MNDTTYKFIKESDTRVRIRTLWWLFFFKASLLDLVNNQPPTKGPQQVWPDHPAHQTGSPKTPFHHPLCNSNPLFSCLPFCPLSWVDEVNNSNIQSASLIIRHMEIVGLTKESISYTLWRKVITQKRLLDRLHHLKAQAMETLVTALWLRLKSAFQRSSTSFHDAAPPNREFL